MVRSSRKSTRGRENPDCIPLQSQTAQREMTKSLSRFESTKDPSKEEREARKLFRQVDAELALD